LNFPLRDGMSDENYKSVFEPVGIPYSLTPAFKFESQVIQEVVSSFDPNVIVLQCGTDSLSGDKLGSLNLSMRGAYVPSFHLHSS
jgi:histone deacetylase 1/2